MPSRNILVINCGSSSIKFALVNEAHSLFPLHGLAERLGSRDAVLRWKRGGDSDSLMIPNADHRAALAQLLPMVQNAASCSPMPRASTTGWSRRSGPPRRWRRCTTRPTCKASRQR